jgi:hypothetical protein
MQEYNSHLITPNRILLLPPLLTPPILQQQLCMSQIKTIYKRKTIPSFSPPFPNPSVLHSCHRHCQYKKTTHYSSPSSHSLCCPQILPCMFIKYKKKYTQLPLLSHCCHEANNNQSLPLLLLLPLPSALPLLSPLQKTNPLFLSLLPFHLSSTKFSLNFHQI